MEDNELDIETQIEGGAPATEVNQEVPATRVWKVTHDLHDREDGLAHCKVCNGAEGSLPTHCPGLRMTDAQEEEAVYGANLDFIGGRWWVPQLPWDEERERQAFEDAAYAHYLRVRQERAAKGQIGLLDNPDTPHTRGMLFQRQVNGDYVAIAYQQAWGGWKLARGGM